MIISIHQSHYLPWINFFLKIKKSDIFVLLDSVSFQKNGIQNRNQIKNTSGRVWLTVPVFNNFGQKISDVIIDNDKNWKKKHYESICQSYSKTKYFRLYKNELEDIYNSDWHNLSALNLKFIEVILKWLNIKTKIVKSSSLDIGGSSTNLLLSICKKLNAKSYLTGEGAKNYLDENIFIKNNIKLVKFKNSFPTKYPQKYNNLGFYNDLSAIDIIFNCGEEWLNYINE